MKRSTLIVLLLSLLPVGIAATHIGSSLLPHRYDDSGAGMFHGFTKGSFMIEDSGASFHFAGQSEPQWHWSSPGNYRYNSLELTWRGDEEGHGTLDLTSFMLTTDGRSFVLTEEALRDLLHGHNDWREPPPENENKVIYDLLVAAEQGTLPPPRHHGHHFADPPAGHLTHFSLGSRTQHAVFAWPVIWSAIVVIVFLKRRHQAVRSMENKAAS